MGEEEESTKSAIMNDVSRSWVEERPETAKEQWGTTTARLTLWEIFHTHHENVSRKKWVVPRDVIRVCLCYVFGLSWIWTFFPFFWAAFGCLTN
jgi:hypothetical protein